MANEVKIRISAEDTTAATLRKTGSDTASEATKIGDAAGSAITSAIEQGVAKVDLGTPVAKAGNDAEAKAKAAGSAAGDDFSAGVEHGAAGIDLETPIKREQAGATSAAGKAGSSAGKEFGDEFEKDAGSGIKGKGKEVAAGFGDEFKIGAAGVGAAAAGFLVDAFGEAMDFAKIKNKMNAQLGLTGGAASAAGEIAGKVYSAGFAESTEGAADAVRATISGKLAQISDEGAVERIAAKVSGLAITTGEDMDAMVKAASNLVKTGLAGNVDEALDLIAKGFTELGPYSDDLLDTLAEYSVQFAQLGLDGPTALGAIKQMVDTGLVPSTDKAADLFKELNIRVHATSVETTDAFTKLGLNQAQFVAELEAGGPRAAAAVQTVFDKLASVKDPVERNRLGVELMGTQWEDTTGKLNGINLSRARDELGRMAGSAKQMADTATTSANTVTGKFAQMQRDVVGFLGRINDAIGQINTIKQNRSSSTFNQWLTGFATGGVTGGFADGGIGSVDKRAAGGGSGGWTQVNERGPELVRLPTGSMVYPTGQSAGMVAGMQGGGAVSIVIDSGGSALDDLMIEVLRKSIRSQGGNVQLVLGKG